jgi:hypothetical protein
MPLPRALLDTDILRGRTDESPRLPRTKEVPGLAVKKEGHDSPIMVGYPT